MILATILAIAHAQHRAIAHYSGGLAPGLVHLQVAVIHLLVITIASLQKLMLKSNTGGYIYYFTIMT